MGNEQFEVGQVPKGDDQGEEEACSVNEICKIDWENYDQFNDNQQESRKETE